MTVNFRHSLFSLLFGLLAGVLLSGCSDGKGPIQSFQYASQGLLSGDISADGRFALIGSVHHGGSLWDVAKKERLYNWNHEAGVYSSVRAVGISGDSKRAVTAVEDGIALWDIGSGKNLTFWKAPARVSALKVSADGRYALLGLYNHRAVYFDLVTGQQVHEFKHQAEVRGVDISADGKRAITGSDDQTAMVWSLETGELIQAFNHRNQIKTVALSPDGHQAFTTAQREDSVIWDVESGKPRVKLPNRYTNFTTARFSENGRQLLLGNFQGQLELLDVSSGKSLAKWKAKPRKAYGGSVSKAVVAVSFGAKPGRVMALTSDGLLQVF
ncbi:MAG: hypothetical protein H6999_00185 [Hahellaceae bacterium]|nr:hypothetical protein [Hahellaceae bacterium]MCP5168168.1 hypothetical protein [Hahellaceae bacterium]